MAAVLFLSPPPSTSPLLYHGRA